MKGRKLKVSLAKYSKGGHPITTKTNSDHKMANSRIHNPSYRDGRSYYSALMGKKQKIVPADSTPYTIPVEFTLNVQQNIDNVKMLQSAIIAENANIINIENITAALAEGSVQVKGTFSLSPTKILLVFECANDVEYAMRENSALWNIFDDIRIWSEGETFDDRLVWLDCYGIHPKFWSEQNIRSIGQKWGPVLQIDNCVENISSLTYARILVRTKAQNKIDARIRMLCEQGSCDVWTKESSNKGGIKDNMKTKVPLTDPKNSSICAQGNRHNPGQHSLNVGEDPLLDTLLRRFDDYEVENRIDPIVDYASGSWEVINNHQNQGSQNQVERSPVTSGWCSRIGGSIKRPRGRPKNSKPAISFSPQSHPHMTAGLTEANETWNTAKNLGISSSDERAAIAGIRKSKRLLLMEEMEQCGQH